MEYSVSSLKKKLRKNIKKLKNEVSETVRKTSSDIIMRELASTKEFQNARRVFIYWAMDDEVDTRGFIIENSKEKDFILPSVDGDDLKLKIFKGTENLVGGQRYDIPEPEGEPFGSPEKIDLAVIPGVAFDKKNNRMGRGGGYYDKILRHLKGKTPLFGVCFGFQMVDSVPVEDHDIQMDRVISD